MRAKHYRTLYEAQGHIDWARELVESTPDHYFKQQAAVYACESLAQARQLLEVVPDGEESRKAYIELCKLHRVARRLAIPGGEL